MWMYWIVFAWFGLMALTHMRPVSFAAIMPQRKSSWIGIAFAFLLLTLTIGLRYEVGGDWQSYLGHVESASGQMLSETLAQSDPAYQFLNWIAANYGGGVYLVNTICAALFSWGLLAFCRIQPRPWLALLIAIPYLVTVVAMGYTRQGTAVGLAMIGLVALSERRMLRFVLFVALAATFHKSALILMPLPVLTDTRNWLWTGLWVGLTTLLFYVLLLQEAVDALVVNYIGAEYESSGAAIRVAMNAFPALIFLLWHRRFEMKPEQKRLWTWVSLGALGFVGLLWISPSSTAVDRVALYWIPLQIVIWLHFPDVFGRKGKRNPIWVMSVVTYSAAVLFVWLFFASHAFAWLPYRFYPWVWLWS